MIKSVGQVRERRNNTMAGLTPLSGIAVLGQKIVTGIKKYKFTALLIFQLLFIFTYPLLEGTFGEWLSHVLATVVFWWITVLATQNKALQVFNVILCVIAGYIYTVDYITYFTDQGCPIPFTVFQWLYDLFFISFFVYVTFLLSVHMLRDKSPKMDTLAGTGSTYLMIGLAWSFFYINLYDLQGGAFKLQTGTEGFGYINWLFYSISNLVGSSYSDIIPVSSYAKCLSLLESVIGALYIAIITARIVSFPIADALRTVSVDDDNEAIVKN